MKKVLALALALIMVLAMGVNAFAVTIVEMGNGNTETDWGFTWINFLWNINKESVIIARYNFGDFATLINGREVALLLGFHPDNNLSSIKVESEKGLIDVTVYKLDDYVKSITSVDTPVINVTGVDTKSSWPFDDFDLEDIIPRLTPSRFMPTAFYRDGDGKIHSALYFVYFDFPTYGGAKLSMDNYFTLKFRENTTGADHVEESEKLWFCVYPWAVDEEDVETYADEDEPMKLEAGHSLIPIPNARDSEDFDEFYDDDQDYRWIRVLVDTDESEIPEVVVTPYVIEKDSWKEIVGSTLMVEAAEDLVIEIGKIVKGQSAICFLSDTDVDDDVQAVNEDAELAALNFLDTTNVLDSDFTISYTFEIEDAAKAGDYFLYELVGDELKLVQKVAVGKGDDEVDVEIERKAGDTLGQYYLSDVELATAAAPEEEDENPNTGASEVAGVAVALAVISLVSAAAVALKK